MRNINLIIICLFLLINNFVSSNLQSQINNTIVVKVGESIITTIDIQNEIITNLIINRLEVTQENIDKNKNYAVKNLINKEIKKSEINKYQIQDYSKKDLKNYTENIARNLNTNINGLKKTFNQFNVSYKLFEEKHVIELTWNTLIYQLYKNQTNINIVDVNNDIDKIRENKSEEELKKIKEGILNQKKEEKLNLFSRSHFSNLENSVSINFK
jgi:Xaa-Pro aminopeptidase